jgi:AcrR family transcriptional regulator
MADVRTTFQEQVAALRRAQILDAAMAVFAARGYHRATIREVARAAEVADGTIYNYFADKEALLLGILDRLNQTEERPAHFARSEAMDFAAFFAHYLGERMALLQENAAVFQALLPELLTNATLRDRYVREMVAPTLAIGEQSFAGLAAAGQMRAVEPALLTRTLAGTVLGLLVLRLLGDEATAARWDEFPAALAELLLHGLLPRKSDDD